MGEQVDARFLKEKYPKGFSYRTDTFQRMERKAKSAMTKVLPLSSRELLLYNWFLPVIRGLKGAAGTLSILMTDKTYSQRRTLKTAY